MAEKSMKKNKFLAWIEVVGNKMPHPFLMFLEITAVVIIFSMIFGLMGTSAIHPSTGEEIFIKNLVSTDGLLLIMLNFVKNFQNFPVLGIVLILGISTGICDRSGFFTTAIKMGLKNVKGNGVVFVVALIGVLSNQAGDAAFILIPAIAGVIFYGLKRNPLAGVFLGYATVGGGFTTSLIPGGWDVTLTPISVTAAKTIDPSFDMSLLSGYFILFLAGIICALTATFVTVRVIEPMLGEYTGETSLNASSQVTPDEVKAVKKAGIAVLIFLVILVAACIPGNSFLRNQETGSLVFQAPLMSSLQFFIIVIFSLADIVYSVSIGKIKTINDLVKMMEESIKTLAPFIVLAVVVGQFLFLFDQSKLGQVLAIKGGNFLASLPIPTQVIAVLFLLLTALINLFIGSGTTKWLIMGPIFVPMLMQLNIHPAFTQVIYRLGDCGTNHLTPLFAYFAILLTTAQQYDKKAGMGTLFSAMLPYSGAFMLVYAILIVIWMTLGLPTGFGGSVWLY